MVAKPSKITWNMVCNMGNEEAQISEYAYDIVDEELLQLEEMVDIHYIEK